MAPKTAVGPEEDVKFLLTIIKQLSGTVSSHFAENHMAGRSLTLLQPDWQKVTDELDLPSKGAA